MLESMRKTVVKALEHSAGTLEEMSARNLSYTDISEVLLNTVYYIEINLDPAERKGGKWLSKALKEYHRLATECEGH